jgi:hypothetical protein
MLSMKSMEITVTMSNFRKTFWTSWLWGISICAQLSIYRVPIAAAVLSTENTLGMRRMLVRSQLLTAADPKGSVCFGGGLLLKQLRRGAAV